MTDKNEGVIAIAAAVLVLLSAMFSPLVSAGIAIIALLGLGAYHFARK